MAPKTNQFDTNLGFCVWNRAHSKTHRHNMHILATRIYIFWVRGAHDKFDVMLVKLTGSKEGVQQCTSHFVDSYMYAGCWINDQMSENKIATKQRKIFEPEIQILLVLPSIVQC